MREKTLALYLKDEIYAYRFMNYCNADPEHRLKAIAFTDGDVFEDYLQKNGADCILCDEATADKRFGAKAAVYKVLTEEEPGDGFSKYEAASGLLSRIEKELTGKEQVTQACGRITAFLSLTDDGTCSRVALEQAGKTPGKTLLVSFSPFFGRDCKDLLEKETNAKEKKTGQEYRADALSSLLFALTSEAPFEIARCVNCAGETDCVYGVAFVRDLDDISPECAERFTEKLEKCDYGHIFLDMGTLRGFTPVLLSACDTIKAVKTGGTTEDERLKELVREFDIAGFSHVSQRVKEAFA